MTKKNEIDTKKNNLPDTLDFSKYQQSTLDDIDRSERVMPYLVVLQDASPQCKKSDPKYRPDAEPGLIMNTATGDILKDPIIIPLHRDKCYCERVPTGDGDDYSIERHEESSDYVRQALEAGRRDDFGWLLGPNGNRVSKTIYLSALLLSEPNSLDAEPVTIVLRRSKLITWKDFMDPIARYNGSHGIPLHANQRVLGSKLATFGKNSTFVFTFDYVNYDPTLGRRQNFFGSLVGNEELMRLADDSVKFILEGKLRRAAENSDSEEEVATVEIKDSEVPF